MRSFTSPASVRPMTGPILGIESSCDETATAVLSPEGAILAERVYSHGASVADFGGVVPEIAARAHLAHLPRLVREVVEQADVAVCGLGAVAASAGPGLIGGLIVGSQLAKGIALSRGLPYIAVNHLEAHALSARIPGVVEGGLRFPYLLLLASGGHCQCLAVNGVGRYRLLGGTIDDAAGEAFDKVAKLLGLSGQGGPALERIAAGGDPSRYRFPRPLLGHGGCDFSFSGLKTAVARTVAALPPGALSVQVAADIAAGFQASVTALLADRVSRAMRMMGGATDVLVIGGGVAANTAVRTALHDAAARHGFRFVAPPIRFCTDNAVMVAWAGIERSREGLEDAVDFAPTPRWPLEVNVPNE